MNRYLARRIIMDRILAIILVIAISPILVVIAIIIALDSGLPIFFIQKRRGASFKKFDLIKFRTMRQNAEHIKHKYVNMNTASGPMFKIEPDPRATRFGRILRATNLDELPQLFNVIKGQMAIIGFRPVLLKESEAMRRIRPDRFDGVPGITSSWVIHGQHKLSFSQWITLDCEYNKKASLSIDIKILGGTAAVVSKSLIQCVLRK